MTSLNYHIIPFADEFLDKVKLLEKGIAQGTQVKLEMIKGHVLDRARVFADSYTCLALTDDQRVIGAATGARTMLEVNGETTEAGIVFDIKVDPELRKRGIGQAMSRNIFKLFFEPKSLTRNFITAKLTNLQAYMLAARVASKVWYYDFVYLTIPTSKRIDIPKEIIDMPQQFEVRLFNREDLPSAYYTRLTGGLGYFHTYKMYRLKIVKINWAYRKGIALLKVWDRVKYGNLPDEGDVLSFATLFNHTPQTIHTINEVLEDLASKGVDQLMVCCQKDDAIYAALKSVYVYQYKYSILSDFNLDKTDHVVIDVRCL